MKISQIAYVSFVCICSLLKGQTEDKTYFKNNEICEVKTFVIFGSDKGNNSENYTIEKYDNNGNKIESFSYSKNKLKNSYQYKFDEFGNKTLTIENRKEDLSNKLKYEYDNKKIIKEFNNFFEDKYFYDVNNRVSKIFHLNKENGETKEIIFKYDDNGNKVSENVEGNPFHINQYLKYNEQNLIIEQENYYHINNENKLYSKFIYEYDNNNKLILEKFVDGYAAEPSTKYYYDENGNLKSVEIENTSITKYFYSKNLIIKKEETKIPLNFKIIENYEYKFCK